MSTKNIISIEPVLAGPVPVGVKVTFKIHGAEGERTYFYNAPEAIVGIMNGEDPSQWNGTRVDGSGAAAGSGIGGSEIGSTIGEIADIAELL